MDYLEKYKQWLNSPYLSEKDKEELHSIADNNEEILDRFYKELDFGTAGMRGKIAIGSNRLNIYTVGKTTQGLANYLQQKVDNSGERGVVIAYDTRYRSREFAEQAAMVLAANGIKTYLFDGFRPTPELSFAVKANGAAAGIVITASHNPPEYNGYKVYGENAAQILPEVANEVLLKIAEIHDYSEVKLIPLSEAKERGLYEVLGIRFDRDYYEKVKTLALSGNEELDKEIKIAYTPLHGTGNIPVRLILEERGFKNIFFDEEQAQPDPQFSTTISTNPENIEAFERIEKLGKEVGTDLLMATDPDCDRIAIAVKNDKNTISSANSTFQQEKCNNNESFDDNYFRGDYVYLNGNQTGALLLNYILSRRKETGKLPKNGFVIKTIVTSEMGRIISDQYGISVYDTLTGFKFICNKADQLEGKGGTFIFGYEESIGYLAGNFVKDKDAVISAMLVAEMAAFYKKNGQTLLDILQNLYQQHGYFLDQIESIFLEGLKGEQMIGKIMADFREEFPTIEGMKVTKKIDYQTPFQYDYEEQRCEIIDIPKSDVLKCVFADGSWYAIRPSGTEPKIKIYLSFRGEGPLQAEQKLKKVKSVILEKIDNTINQID